MHSKVHVELPINHGGELEYPLRLSSTEAPGKVAEWTFHCWSFLAMAIVLGGAGLKHRLLRVVHVLELLLQIGSSTFGTQFERASGYWPKNVSVLRNPNIIYLQRRNHWPSRHTTHQPSLQRRENFGKQICRGCISMLCNKSIAELRASFYINRSARRKVIIVFSTCHSGTLSGNHS